MTSMQFGARCRSTTVLTTLVLACACVLPVSSALAQTPSPAPVNLGDNAALKYWVAFGLLQNLSPEQQKLLRDWKTLPMDKATIAVIDQGKLCLDVLRQAAQTRPCDWGLIYAGSGTLMPHLWMAHKAVQLACLRARYLAGKLDSEGAVSDFLAAFTLVRQVNSGGISSGIMLEWYIEKTVTDAAAGCLTQLTRAQLRRLAAGLDALPARKGFREDVLSAQADAKWLTDRINAMNDEAKENEIKMWLMLSGSNEGLSNFLGTLAGDEPSRAKAEKDWATMKLTPQELSEYTRGFDKAPEHYKELAELGPLPLPEFDRRAKAIEDKMKTDCPFAARFLFSALPRERYFDAESEARIAMLKAAIAVVLEGPDRIKEFKDPYGDGPFEYSKLGEGFELKSKLIVWQNKPTTLSVSAPP